MWIVLSPGTIIRERDCWGKPNRLCGVHMIGTEVREGFNYPILRELTKWEAVEYVLNEEVGGDVCSPAYEGVALTLDLISKHKLTL